MNIGDAILGFGFLSVCVLTIGLFVVMIITIPDSSPEQRTKSKGTK